MSLLTFRWVNRLTANSASADRRIFVSHLHGDHCYGLFGLLGSRAMTGTSAPLVLIGPRGLEEMITTVLRLSANHLSYELDILDRKSVV